MLTKEMAAAYDELSAMDKNIDEAESNLRVLEKLNSPKAVDLRAKIVLAKQKRADAMAAIQAEGNS